MRMEAITRNRVSHRGNGDECEKKRIEKTPTFYQMEGNRSENKYERYHEYEYDDVSLHVFYLLSINITTH